MKFSLERVKSGLRASSNFRPIERVDIVDPYTVRVQTSKPWPTFTAIMTFRQASMYPPKAYAGKDSPFISKNPIGTGPYKLVRWSKDEEIVLEANDQYWRGASKIKTVVFRPIPDDAVRVAALQNGEVDVAVNIPPHLATTSTTIRSSSCPPRRRSARSSSCSSPMSTMPSTSWSGRTRA